MEKLNWLDEVKADAEYITRKRIRDMEEERAFKQSKQVSEVKEVVAEPTRAELISQLVATGHDEKDLKKMNKTQLQDLLLQD